MSRLTPPTLEAGTCAHYRNARYYDQTYRLRSEDVAYYRAQALRFGGPVLELGVGTGRIARAMASVQIDVLGIDASESMLAQAKRRVANLDQTIRRRITLRCGDIRAFRSRRRFPLVVAPFNVLMHMYTRQDWERVLRTVHRHLTPRGKFVFDILMPDPGELTRDPERVYRGRDVSIPGETGRFRYGESFEYDPVSQIQLVTMQFEPKGRGKSGEFVTPLCHRQVFPAELEALLHYNGFRILERYGDFSKSPLSEESESQVVVAESRLPRS